MAIVSFLRKTRTAVSSLDVVDGQIIFETDQGDNSKLYMDNGSDRIIIGGKTDVQDNLTSTSTSDALSANQGKVLNDKVESLGVENGTGYIKHADGTLICYGVISIDTISSDWGLWGAIYIASLSTTFVFPKEFIATPQLNLTINTTDGTSGGMIVSNSHNRTSVLTIGLARGTQTAGTCKFDYQAIGRWK